MARDGRRAPEIAAALKTSRGAVYNMAIENDIAGPRFRRATYLRRKNEALRARGDIVHKSAAAEPDAPASTAATTDLPPDLVAALAGVPNGRGEYRWINQIAERFGLTTAQVQLRLFRVRAA